jgi:exoribonuclease-2
MGQMTLREGSLVLYKNRPARVARVGGKIEIELEGGETLKVRPKDVTGLHPGPMDSLSELEPQAGEVKTAWELLAGGTTSLTDLAELAFGAYTAATAWAAWELVADGLYFQGTPQEVVARTPEEVAQERETREARAAEREAWEGFLERARAGRVGPEDTTFLQDVEALALGHRDESRVLREMGRAVIPENAHALLLELGYWDRTLDPYPTRLRLNTTLPEATLPGLPEEERLDLTTGCGYTWRTWRRWWALRVRRIWKPAREGQTCTCQRGPCRCSHPRPRRCWAWVSTRSRLRSRSGCT